MKVIWEKNVSKLVDKVVKQDIENQVQEKISEIHEIKKFLKGLDDSLSCHAAFPISEYGRKGDREGSFELVCMFNSVWIIWDSSYTKVDFLKDKMISQLVAIVEE